MHLRGADLRGADFRDAHLSSINFWSADLSHAELSNADLSRSRLRDARLIGAILRDAVLNNAIFSGAILRDAHLCDANLRGAILNYADVSNADLSGADLSYASVSKTTFGNVDLRHVKGLESVQHLGSSTLGNDTIYQSYGDIPDIFLRDCGLPDEMIGFVHSITGAIQYYSAFISYNHQDETFATRLYNDLQANNVRCWKYTEDVKIGDEIQRAVDQAIRFHDKLLVIFSAQSVQSDWVADEVERAMKREEQEHKPILFPVMIDDAINQVDYGWARRVRRHRNIGDFTAWKGQEEQYQPMFDRPLRDLTANSR